MGNHNLKSFYVVLLAAMGLLTACGGATTQTDSTAAAIPVITSMGTDFYLTLPDHLCSSAPTACTSPSVSNKLIVAGSSATSGEVTFNNVVTPFSIVAGGQTVIALDSAVVLSENETVQAKAIHVTTLAPVSVHVISENVGSADGYLALPTPGLGTRYYVMSYASSLYSGSEFSIVATQDNTSIDITPTAAGASRPAGLMFTVLLNRGETYLFANPAHADMTGTLLTSDKPIAVFSGHRCANVPSGTGYCDYLVEQLPDVTRWGKTHHTMLFSGRARYTVRVMAAQDGTTFTTLPAGLIGTLNAGQYADVTLTGAAEFVSNYPVLVAQFMRGYADDAAQKGDPSMVLVTPAESAVTNATFGVHGLAQTPGAYLSVVAETAAITGLQLDGQAVDTALFSALGATSIYSVATLPVAPGVHQLQGTGYFSALVYDYGYSWNSLSYAYPVAMTLSAPAPAPAVPEIPVCDSEPDHRHGHEHGHGHGNGNAYGHEKDHGHGNGNAYGHEKDHGHDHDTTDDADDDCSE